MLHSILFLVLINVLVVDNTDTYSNILTIGAIHQRSGGQVDHPTTQVTHTTNWYQNIAVEIVWSHVDNNNCFKVLQEAKRLQQHTDLLIFDDELSVCVGHGLKQTELSRPILYYKGRQSMMSEPKKARPLLSGYLMCGFEDLDISEEEEERCEINLDADVSEEPEVSISRAETIFAIVKSLHWENIFLFYEENTIQEAMELTDLLSKANIDIFMYDLDSFDNETQVHEMLTTNCILDIRTSHFIVLSSINTTKWILAVADSLDRVRNSKIASFSMISQWLILLPNETKSHLENCVSDLDNVAVIIYPPSKYIFIHNMLKGLPLSVKEILKKVGTLNITEAVNVTDLQLETKNFFIKYFTHPLMCWHSDIYTLLWKPDGRELNHVGFVNISGDVILDFDIFPNRFYGLNKRLLTVATMPYEPFVKLNESKPNTTLTYPYEGYCMDILTELALSMNFTIKMIGGSPDSEFGLDSGNGTWTGLIGMLQREEVDLVVGSLTVIVSREKVMDFTFPFYHDFLSVLIKKPDPSLTKWRTMIDPFRWEVLLCIGISLVAASVILFLLEKWNPFYQREPYLIRYAGTHIFQDAFWYMFGAMLTQGGEHLPDSQAGRTMISTWWLFSIIMAATYSGNLIAFLTVTKDTAPFETLDELMDNGDYSWGLLGGTQNQMEFENSKNPIFKKAWKGIIENSDTDVLNLDHEIHLSKVSGGEYGYISDRGSLQKRVLTDCDLYLLPEKMFPINYALALQNESALTELFTKEMMAIYESGLLQIWQRQWWNQKKFCRGPLQTEAKAIDLVDIQSSFYLIGVGLFLAAIALIVERCMLRFCKCRTSARRENVVHKPNDLQNGHAHKPIENGLQNGLQNGPQNGLQNGLQNGHVGSSVRSEIYSSVRKQNGHTQTGGKEIVSNGHVVADVNGNAAIDFSHESIFDYDTEYARTSL